jgi:hypothetical protein
MPVANPSKIYLPPRQLWIGLPRVGTKIQTQDLPLAPSDWRKNESGFRPYASVSPRNSSCAAAWRARAVALGSPRGPERRRRGPGRPREGGWPWIGLPELLCSAEHRHYETRRPTRRFESPGELRAATRPGAVPTGSTFSTDSLGCVG